MKDEKITNRIESVMKSAMEHLKEFACVDVVVGKPIDTKSGILIIPISKITMGFVAGGGEYNSDLKDIRKEFEYPFAGGSSSGIGVSPVGFLVVDGKSVDLIKIDSKTAVEKLIETVPEVAKFISKNLKSEKDKKKN